MPTSGNSVYHYTQEWTNFIKILSEGFKLSYCKETIIVDDKPRTFAVPILSFCDIPLSQVKDHMLKYGRYAIGMTMEWAIQYGLNPVLYLESHSIVNRSLNSVLDFLHEDWHKLMDKNTFSRFYDTTYKSTVCILKSIKNYEGPLTRDGRTRRYKFYDEREWRYTPVIADEHNDEYPDIFWGDEFDDLRKRFPSKPHFNKYVIPIKTKDIRHLILHSEHDIPLFIEDLKKMPHLYNDNAEEFQLLLTKIKTATQIEEDY
jgi:hypothetical protein